MRGASRRELAATAVLAVRLDEASAKLRAGGVVDDPADLGLPVWAGVLPLRLAAGAPQPDAGVELPTPAHVAGWARPAVAKERLESAS